MDYLTTAEYAKIWNISQRRVAIYCKDGRIKGAVLKGKVWLIPINTCKPQDPRSKKYNKEENPLNIQRTVTSKYLHKNAM